MQEEKGKADNLYESIEDGYAEIRHLVLPPIVFLAYAFVLLIMLRIAWPGL